MPVLITIATVNALFRPGSEQISFLDPEALRARCNDVIEDTETRARAVMLTEELQRLALHYHSAVAASVEAYLAKSAQWDSSANDLIELLQPMDNARTRTVQEIVRVRQSMRELLSTEQWNQVFQ
jgi:Spy/CpxP family protein refolding chaperone